MKGIILPRNCLQFLLVKVIVSQISYRSLENNKNEHFFTTNHRKVIRKFFQGLQMYHIDHKFDGTDQGYQSHQFLTELDVLGRENDANEELSNLMSRSVPLQNRTFTEVQ